MKKTFKIIVSIFCVFLITGCAGMFAPSLVHANRQPVIKNPSDYGLEYEKIEFKTPDNLTLRGWYMPGASDVIVIMTHPMNFTKYGYSIENQGSFRITEVEVEFLKTAKMLHDLGYNVITFDLRNHGESDDSPDKIFGLGVFEYQDVVGCLDFIESRKDLKNKPVVFDSYCTGANATLIAMSKNPEKFRNVKCVAAVQPISMKVFVENFMKDKYPQFVGMIPDIEKECVNMGGLPWKEMDPTPYAADSIVPVKYFQVSSDKWTDVDFVKHIFAVTPEPKEIFILESDTMERFDMYNYFADHPEPLVEFFEKYVK